MYISASKIRADVEKLSIRRLWVGMDKDIFASRRGIDPMDIVASNLRAGIDNGISASRRGIDFMDADMLSAAMCIESRRNLFGCATTLDSVLTMASSCFVEVDFTLTSSFKSWETPASCADERARVQSVARRSVLSMFAVIRGAVCRGSTFH